MCVTFKPKTSNLMELYISTVKEFLHKEEIVNVIIDNLHLIHDNPDSRTYVIDRIANFLGTLHNDLTILVETEYVDKVYRDSYYTLYSTKLSGYSRNCVRISFFTSDFNENTSITVTNIEAIRNAYLGFLVIRPLAECCIGRNVISPEAKKGIHPGMCICKASIPATCMGIKMQVAGFPHSSLAIKASNYLAIRKLQVPKMSVIRTFLASNRTYREYIMKNGDMTEEEKLVYLQIDMPKFVWVTEISDRTSFFENKVNSLILLDATGSNVDNEGYSSLLFYQTKGIGTLFNRKIRWFENIPISLPSRFETFNDNLN